MIVRKHLSNILVLVLITWSAPAALRAEDCDQAREWYSEGLALGDESNREVSYYQKAIELCPGFFEAHNRLGEIYKSWGQYELAVKEFEQASRNWLFAEPHNNLGEIYKMQGRYDLAEKEFTRAIRIRPDFRKAQNNLKYVRKRLGMFDSTIEAPPEPLPSGVFARAPGLTLPEGTFLVDLQYKYWTQKAGLEGVTAEAPLLDDTITRRIDVHAWIWGIRYGLTDNFTIGVLPKFFDKTARVKISYWNIDSRPNVKGFGDTGLLTKYRVWGRRNRHISVFNVLNIPTGDEKKVGSDAPVTRRIPLGSGSYDLSPGMAITTVEEPLTIHASALYTISGGGGISGDEFQANLALSLPRFLGFTITCELNYKWTDATSRKQLYQKGFGYQPGGEGGIGGPYTFETNVEEEEGHSLFISPSAQFFVTKTIKVELGMQHPIIEPRGGWVKDIVFHVGLASYFF